MSAATVNRSLLIALRVASATLFIFLSASARAGIVSADLFTLADGFVGGVCAVAGGLCGLSYLLALERRLNRVCLGLFLAAVQHYLMSGGCLLLGYTRAWA